MSEPLVPVAGCREDAKLFPIRAHTSSVSNSHRASTGSIFCCCSLRKLRGRTCRLRFCRALTRSSRWFMALAWSCAHTENRQRRCERWVSWVKWPQHAGFLDSGCRAGQTWGQKLEWRGRSRSRWMEGFDEPPHRRKKYITRYVDYYFINYYQYDFYSRLACRIK